jgi:hypothetical protein
MREALGGKTPKLREGDTRAGSLSNQQSPAVVVPIFLATNVRLDFECSLLLRIQLLSL